MICLNSKIFYPKESICDPFEVSYCANVKLMPVNFDDCKIAIIYKNTILPTDVLVLVFQYLHDTVKQRKTMLINLINDFNRNNLYFTMSTLDFEPSYYQNTIIFELYWLMKSIHSKSVGAFTEKDVCDSLIKQHLPKMLTADIIKEKLPTKRSYLYSYEAVVCKLFVFYLKAYLVSTLSDFVPMCDASVMKNAVTLYKVATRDGIVTQIRNLLTALYVVFQLCSNYIYSAYQFVYFIVYFVLLMTFQLFLAMFDLIMANIMRYKLFYLVEDIIISVMWYWKQNIGSVKYFCRDASFQHELLVCTEASAHYVTVLFILAWLFLLYLIYKLSGVALRMVRELCSVGRTAVRNSSINAWLKFKNFKNDIKLDDVTRTIELSSLLRLPLNVNTEMSIKNSSTVKSKFVPGLIVFRTTSSVRVADGYEDRQTVLGTGFRYGDYLVTALHVVEQIANRTDVLFTVNVEDKEGFGYMGKRYSTKEISEEDNLVNEDDATRYDIYIKKCDNPFWTDLGVKSLKSSKSEYGVNVSTYGILVADEDGRYPLNTASGQTQKSEDEHRIAYNSTTAPGWSGSPVMRNKKVIALHQKTNGILNIGLRIELIDFLIRGKEVYEVTPEYKWDPVEKVFRDQWGYEAETDIDGSGRRYALSKNGRITFLDPELLSAKDQDYYYDRYENNIENEINNKTDIYYEDEQLIEPGLMRVSKNHKGGDAMQVGERRLRSAPLVIAQNVNLEQSFIPVDKVTTPFYKRNNNCDFDTESAKALGYIEGKYAFPLAKSVGEARDMVDKSFVLHVKDHIDVISNAVIPDKSHRRKAMQLTIKQLKKLQYKMIPEPLSKQNIENIINSSRIKSTKSPGFPYIAEGLTTNAAVIANGGLVEAVQNGGEEPANVFVKLDAHTMRKISSGKNRLISGLSLNLQIETHCYFGELNDTAASNYRATPVMIGFSPLKPGDGEWFLNSVEEFVKIKEKKLKKKFKLGGHDTENYDFSQDEWLVDDTCNITVALAVPHSSMSEDDSYVWRQQAMNTLKKNYGADFRLPSGALIKKKKKCIMASGSVITLINNSITNLYIDNLAKIMMGLKNSEIEENFLVRVGGDDNMQVMPEDFDHDKYCEMISSMGMKLHDIEASDDFKEINFYSWNFTRDESGCVTWIPKRFSKHVETLQSTKIEVLGDSLISHMRNYAHDKDKFDWFKKEYLKLSEGEHRDYFPISNLVDRTAIVDYLYGLEFGSILGNFKTEIKNMIYDKVNNNN